MLRCFPLLSRTRGPFIIISESYLTERRTYQKMVRGKRFGVRRIYRNVYQRPRVHRTFYFCENRIKNFLGCYLTLQYRFQSCFHRANQSLPYAAHMRRIGRIESPFYFVSFRELLNFVIAYVTHFLC